MIPVRLLLLIFLIVTLVRPVWGQTDPSVTDTLDWRQYYPLEIGNVWEYKDDNFPLLHLPSYQRREIIGDTLIGDREYFVLYSRVYDTNFSIVSEGETYLRYDTLRHTVIQLSTSGCCPGEYDYIACDLSAAFNQEIMCDDGSQVFVLGGYLPSPYVIGLDTVYAPAEKHFNFGGPGITLAHGIGDVGGPPEGANNMVFLVYLKSGGRVYGESIVTTSAESESDLPNTIYIRKAIPNPFTNTTTLQYNLALPAYVTVNVFDMLGRRVVSLLNEQQAPGERHVVFDATAHPAGLYVLVLSTGNAVLTHRVVHVR